MHPACTALIAGVVPLAVALFDPASVRVTDVLDDAAPRRTDPGGDGPYDPQAHRLIDLHEFTIGKWDPVDAQTDLFAGSFVNNGKFVRLDLIVGGLVNPPGSVDPLAFDPFHYGDHPIFGFVEIDMDQSVETGGELDAPEYRYLGNIARFGGKPTVAEFVDRVALDETAFDDDITSPPFVDRHGEEFHLALLGSEFSPADISEVAGDSDRIFESGETWWIHAPLFHRAHGYEPFSLAQGGAVPGEYSPDCTVQFAHSLANGTTLISLVFPLKNAGAGQMAGEPPEPDNSDPSDQASVKEALIDLHDSAVFLDMFPTGLPEEVIITEWQNQEADWFLNPISWDITVLLGTSYTAADPTGEFFVWTDVSPDVVRGDVNGDGVADESDRQLIEQYILDNDAADGQVDGRVLIPAFADAFSVFDVSHDGATETLDVLLVAPLGDMDDDGDVDLGDYSLLQTCFSGVGTAYAPQTCGLADADADGDVDLGDMGQFEEALTGPGGGGLVKDARSGQPGA